MCNGLNCEQKDESLCSVYFPVFAVPYKEEFYKNFKIGLGCLINNSHTYTDNCF